MVSKTVKVVNKAGFHMRPASQFVNEMGKFQSSITIEFGGRSIDAKSIMSVMSACIKYGSEIEIRCDGPDEQQMLDKAAGMIESGFGEE